MIPNSSKHFLKEVRSKQELEDASKFAIWKQRVGIKIKQVIKAFQKLERAEAQAERHDIVLSCVQGRKQFGVTRHWNMRHL